MRRAKRGELSSEDAGINGTGWRRTRGPFADVGSRRSPVVCSSRARVLLALDALLARRGEWESTVTLLGALSGDKTRRRPAPWNHFAARSCPVQPGEEGMGMRVSLCVGLICGSSGEFGRVGGNYRGSGQAEVSDPVRLRPPSPSPRAPPAPSRFAAEGV